MTKNYDFSMSGYLKVQAQRMHKDITEEEYQDYMEAFHNYLEAEYEEDH